MEINTAELVLPFRPISKPRPRATIKQARPYMDKVYTEWKKNVRAFMGEWWTEPPLEFINCLIVHFHGPARGDLDNRLGSVLDAGNGLIWSDDNVTVINAVAMRHYKKPTKEAHVYMKLIWPRR
jgi:Holliday junction resolvase RusA-like endonuclease